MTKEEKRLAKESKQLKSLIKERSRPTFKGYFAVLMCLIILFQLLDMMATTVWNNLQEVIVRDFAGLAHDAVAVFHQYFNNAAADGAEAHYCNLCHVKTPPVLRLAEAERPA